MGKIVYQEIDLTLASDATQDIWSIVGTAAKQIRMHGWELTSEAVAAAMIHLQFHRITASGSVGAASATEELADEEYAAHVGVFRTEDTTPGADGSGMMGYKWEQLGPVGHVWTPEMRPIAKVSEGFALTMNTAATPVLAGWVCWEEI